MTTRKISLLNSVDIYNDQCDILEYTQTFLFAIKIRKSFVIMFTSDNVRLVLELRLVLKPRKPLSTTYNFCGLSNGKEKRYDRLFLEFSSVIKSNCAEIGRDVAEAVQDVEAAPENAHSQ